MRAGLLYPLRLLQPRPPPLSFNHPLPRTTAHPFTWMNIDRHPTWNSPRPPGNQIAPILRHSLSSGTSCRSLLLRPRFFFPPSPVITTRYADTPSPPPPSPLVTPFSTYSPRLNNAKRLREMLFSIRDRFWPELIIAFFFFFFFFDLFSWGETSFYIYIFMDESIE